ncbi:MAG: DUF429 domain-containing protein [Anaerolineales bacterium]|nr:DUF429 domain-containing protein [Anaerolineales bacterium]
MIVIGVDCATVDKRIGLAKGKFENSQVAVLEVASGKDQPVLETILDWLPPNEPALLGLDAPLGWPAALGQQLAGHMAGKPIREQPGKLFNRHTDHFIHNKLGKKPLEVGADRIARTALAALKLIEGLRHRSGNEIIVGWNPAEIVNTAVIEVYPAATLIAYNAIVPGYKKPAATTERQKVLTSLKQHMEIKTAPDLMLASPDVLDAAICVLAGADYLKGQCYPPDDLTLAQKEGWIWVKEID